MRIFVLVAEARAEISDSFSATLDWRALSSRRPRSTDLPAIWTVRSSRPLTPKPSVRATNASLSEAVRTPTSITTWSPRTLTSRTSISPSNTLRMPADHQAVGQVRGRVGDQDGHAGAEVEAEAAAAGERERLAGGHLAEVLDRARQDEPAGRLDGGERRADQGAALAVVGADDAGLEVAADVEAEGRGAGARGAEALGGDAPVVAERGGQPERALRVHALATLGEVLGADLVDLGGQGALAEPAREARHQGVEVLERQVASGHAGGRVQLGRRDGDAAVGRGAERVVEGVGRVARADVDEVIEVELLGVRHQGAHGRQPVALALAGDRQLVVPQAVGAADRAQESGGAEGGRQEHRGESGGAHVQT